MKPVTKLTLCLAGSLAVTPFLYADDVLAGNPYAVVVARNIFGLNPPPPPGPVTPDDASLPKITPNGIMSIFGQLQVLFKVTPAGKPAKPGGDDAYILSEGQRQDDIEVVKIDEKGGLVTFDNHGTRQELPLVAATAVSAPAGGAPAANPAVRFPVIPGRPAGTVPGAGFNNNIGNQPAGNFGGRNPGAGNSGAYGGNTAGTPGAGLNFGNAPAGNKTYNAASEIPPGMTPEVQTIMIEANREAALQRNDADAAMILPITEITPGQPDSGQNP